MYEIRMPVEGDLDAYRSHVSRHTSESGKGGGIIFIPFEGPLELSEDRLRSQLANWQSPTTQIGWGRCWILSNGPEIVGSVEFAQRPPMKSAIHRTTLMMGLESEARGHGWGGKLVEVAIRWAREQLSIEYIDLRVFAHNKSALNLYKKFGFEETGRINDCFRLQGQRVDDILMTLMIRESPGKNDQASTL